MPDGTAGFITLRFKDIVFVRRVKPKTNVVASGIQLGPKADIPELASTISESVESVMGTTQHLASKVSSLTTTILFDLTDDHKNPLPDADDYPIGEYILERGASLTETKSHSSKQLGMMDAGTRIRVLEVVFIPKHHRIRGRIVGPGGHTGFVTLFGLGQVFVRRAESSTSSESPPTIEIA